MDKNKKQPQQKIPRIGNQIIIAIFIFISITIVYSLLAKTPSTVKQLAISDVAKSVTDGTVEKIDVVGQDITVTFKDKTTGTTKKEAESSLSDTLVHYGVTPAQLATTPIEVKDESGFGYWILNILKI